MFKCLFLGLATAALLAVPASATGSAGGSAHAYSFENIDGGQIHLADYAGRPILVVNTASRCGFTHQYNGLQELYDTYRDRGLVVLTVPSDDFGGQELATEAEVKHFCEVNFNLDLPMTTITKVRGSRAHPFYLWARDAFGRNKAPGWNFHKYLIGPDGQPVASFHSGQRPMSRPVVQAVEALLAPGA